MAAFLAFQVSQVIANCDKKSKLIGNNRTEIFDYDYLVNSGGLDHTVEVCVRKVKGSNGEYKKYSLFDNNGNHIESGVVSKKYIQKKYMIWVQLSGKQSLKTKTVSIKVSSKW